MKKVLLVLGLGLAIFSCNKEEVAPNNETVVKNCDCDRILDVKKVDLIVEDTINFAPFELFGITAINECDSMTSLYREFFFKNEASIPKVGDCIEMFRDLDSVLLSN